MRFPTKYEEGFPTKYGEGYRATRECARNVAFPRSLWFQTSTSRLDVVVKELFIGRVLEGIWHVSISMHLDEYMARRGISPDDTVIPEDACQVFDGKVEKRPGDAESKERLDVAEDLVRDLLS